MNKLLVLLVLGVTTLGISQVEYTIPKPKQILKVSRLGTRDVALVCLDGADPAGYKRGNVLIVSCGKETENAKK